VIVSLVCPGELDRSSKKRAVSASGASEAISKLAPKPPVRDSGIASWYGVGNHHGKYTATGELFDPLAMTCASRTIPLGTIIRVERVKTGDVIWCRVNDRGPYWAIKKDGEGHVKMKQSGKGRWRNMLDLSLGSARALSGETWPGNMEIEVRYWYRGGNTFYRNFERECGRYVE
jgi:hypothetical protein